MKYWKEWAKRAGVRAIKTMAQTVVAMLPVAVSITDVDWWAVLGTAALAGITSLVTSLAGIPEVPKSQDADVAVEDETDGGQAGTDQ